MKSYLIKNLENTRYEKINIIVRSSAGHAHGL